MKHFALPLPPLMARFVRAHDDLPQQRRQWVYLWVGALFPPAVILVGLVSGVTHRFDNNALLWIGSGLLMGLACTPTLFGMVRVTMPLICVVILTVCTISEYLNPASFSGVAGLATVIALVSLTESSRRILAAGGVALLCASLPAMISPTDATLPVGLDISSRVGTILVITGLAYVGARVSTKALNDLRANIEDNQAMAQILHENLANLEATVTDRTRSLATRTSELETINADLHEAVAGEARLAQQLRRQSLHDELTGLVNRRGFMNMLNDVESVGGWIVMADLDHFKAINDTWGHPAGDQALCMFADTLRQVTPADGLAARVGGEEFAVVLPGPREAEEMTAFLDRLLAEVRSLKVPAMRGTQVTVSLGAAGFSARQTTPSPAPEPLADHLSGFDTPSSVTRRRQSMEALRCADQALYQAKEGGRDRAVISRSQ